MPTSVCGAYTILQDAPREGAGEKGKRRKVRKRMTMPDFLAQVTDNHRG